MKKILASFLLTCSFIPASYASWNNSQQETSAGLLWLFSFDEDNWFAFNKVHEQTQSYLAPSDRMYQDDRIELRLFKGAIDRDLPVTLDMKEKTLTLWYAYLQD